jgi:DNA-directed RNA polymerase specialized sigma24 family protein
MDEHGGGSWTADESAAMADWSQTVNQYATTVWHRARQSTANPTRAAEISQLVWLRLELTTRDGKAPADLERWLLQQVHDECTGRRHDRRAGESSSGGPADANAEGEHDEA